MLTQTGVDMIMGVFSSAHCVPLATKVDTAKKFFWINTCISPAVLQDRHLRYVFRPQVHGGQFGEMSPDMRSEEHTSELQSLMRISYAVFCLKKKKVYIYTNDDTYYTH